METISWSELISKKSKFWRIHNCHYRQVSISERSVCILTRFCVGTDNHDKFKVVRAPFANISVLGPLLTVNDLKRIIRAACEEQGLKCVTGFQNVKVYSDDSNKET